MESLLAISSSTVPLTTISPPRDPAPGPKSTTLIGFPDGLFIMFDDDDCVAHIAQVFEGGDEFFVVARVQSYGWFVEDVCDADQAAAYL